MSVALVALLAAAVLAVSGCGGAPDPVAVSASVSPSPTGPPADGGSYATPQAVVDALRAGGLVCAGLREIAYKVEGRTAAAKCIGEGREEVLIATWSNSIYLNVEVTAWAAGPLPVTLGGLRASMVSGQDWHVAAPDVWADRAHRVLGGKLTVSAA